VDRAPRDRGGAGVIPRLLRARRFSSFGDLTLDLTTLEPGIVAIVGETGSGKTTLMDALGGPAVWWRELPTHGMVREFCVGRDAEIELVYDYGGETYRSLLQIDTEARGGAGKDEAYLFRRVGDAWESLTPGRTNDYRDEVLRRMPDQDLYMAAAYAAQDRGGSFFSMAVPERRKLFERLLGLGALQRRSDRAGAARAILDGLLEQVGRDAERTRADAATAERLNADLTAALAALAPLVLAEKQAGQAAQAADRAHAEAAAAVEPLRRERAAALARASTLHAEFGRAELALSDAKRALQDLRATTADEATVRASAAGLVTAGTKLRETREAFVVARAEASARRSEQLAAERAAEAASAVLVREREARSRAGSAAAELQAAVRDAGDPSAARAEADRLSRLITATEAELLPRLRSNRAESSAADLRLRDARTQLDAARSSAGLLDGVPCGGGVLYTETDYTTPQRCDGEPIDCGSCRFLTTAQAAAATVPDLEARIPVLEAAAAAARSSLDADIAAESGLVALRADRDRAAALVAARSAEEGRLAVLRERAADLERATTAEAAAHAEATRLTRAALDARAVTLAAEAAQSAAEEAGRAAAAHVATLAGADETLRILEAALAQLPHAEARVAELAQRLSDASAALAAHVVPPDPDDRNEAAAAIEARLARQVLDEARRQVRTAEASAALLRGRLAQLGNVAARAAEVEAKRVALAEKRAGFALVERAFGPRGIQALEIDAAGPEVSTLTNELLAATFGPRFTTRLRTVQDAGAGKVQREVFDLEIFDGQRGGKPAPYRHISGGQQVMVSAALRLALVIATARRHGTRLESLFLDEADTGLDEGLRAAYPAMLRRARELGGFRWVFFISHSQAAWQQADAKIIVAGGTARIES